MTSPAIGNGNNGQKEASKAASTSNVTLAQGPSRRVREVISNSPLTAWWRVFKLANMLLQQKC